MYEIHPVRNVFLTFDPGSTHGEPTLYEVRDPRRIGIQQTVAIFRLKGDADAYMAWLNGRRGGAEVHTMTAMAHDHLTTARRIPPDPRNAVEKFWVNIELEDRRLFRHPDQHLATQEAARLAKSNPGKTFLTFSPLQAVRTPEIVVALDLVDHPVPEQILTEDDIPF